MDDLISVYGSMPDRTYAGSVPVMRIRTRIGGTFTALDGRDIAIPEIEASIDGPELPYRLHLVIAVVHGRPVCTSLTAERLPDGAPVTRRGLNSLPVDKLVRMAAAQSAATISRGDGWTSYDLVTPEQSASVLAGLTPRRGRRGDPGAREELVRKVVIAYRDLLAAKVKQPKPAIAKSLGISVSYVSALLADARRQGLLGPAIPGRAGEAE